MNRIKILINERRSALLTAASYQQILDRVKDLAQKAHNHLLALQKPDSKKKPPE